MTTKTRVAMIGCGGMARYHLSRMVTQTETTEVCVICEPSAKAYAAACEIFVAAGLAVPPNEPDLARLLADYALDAVFIITPHALHHDQALACMEAGLDVLLEKPMVINAAEARSLIEVRHRTGRLLVVAFQGSLSPQIRTAEKMLRSGELGRLLSISGTVWQNWGDSSANTWRQVPALSGGGFLFDTGAHMLNTIVDLAGEGFVEVAAWMDNHGRAVETLSVIMGRLASGAMVTIHACGETIPSCASDIRLFCTDAIVRTGMWGERLELQRAGETELTPVAVPEWLGPWEHFIAIRNGEMANASPPEVGLRMVKLYDAIKASAAQNGVPVTLSAK